jgi:hypothetical protein
MNNNQLMTEYTELANRYGWLSPSALVWRFKHRHNTEVMGLVRNAHHVRSFFRHQSMAAIEQWYRGQ